MARRTVERRSTIRSKEHREPQRDELSARKAFEATRMHMVIDPTDSVRINFEVASGEDGATWPFFECRGCEALLQWEELPKFWRCPACSYELTPREARLLIAGIRLKVASLTRYVDKKENLHLTPAPTGLWAWLRGLWARVRPARKQLEAK